MSEVRPPERLIIHEIFASIQGESSFAGLPFVFIRLCGCSLHCRYCDTAGAWDPDTGREMTVPEIRRVVAGYKLAHVCVTGGEPLEQGSGCRELLKGLIEDGYVVTLETSGTVSMEEVPAPVHRIMDIKCPSSGVSHAVVWANLDALTPRDEVKCVIGTRADFDFVVTLYRERLSAFQGPIWVSPVDRELAPADLAKWILSAKIPLRLHLQLHKIIGMK